MPFLHIILSIKDCLQQQIHSNGNIFETNAVVVTRVHCISDVSFAALTEYNCQHLQTGHP